MSRVARARSLAARLAMMSVGFLSVGCWEDAGRCDGDETVVVNMTGTCAAGPRTFEIRRVSCGLYLSVPTVDAGSAPGSPASLGLPLRGQLDLDGFNVRRGNWSVWGCVSGTEPCPDQFRLCRAERVDFQLNLSCLDGAGAPTCEAVLTE